MEECWNKVWTEPLDCLNCKRIKNRTLLDKPDDPIFSAFVDGWEIAMKQIAIYITPPEHPLSEYHKDMLIGIDINFKCVIDRGVSLKVLQYALQEYTTAVLKLVFRRQSMNPETNRV